MWTANAAYGRGLVVLPVQTSDSFGTQSPAFAIDASIINDMTYVSVLGSLRNSLQHHIAVPFGQLRTAAPRSFFMSSVQADFTSFTTTSHRTMHIAAHFGELY